MNDRGAEFRAFFARYVTCHGGATDPRIEAAFAAVKREDFIGAPPWFIAGGAAGYFEVPDNDVAFLYQNNLVALDRARGINNGEPSLHARGLDALAVQAREEVLHVGAGGGYYSAILARLGGRIHAFEIDPVLADLARRNLAGLPNVVLEARSGVAGDLPKADAIYVNAGVSRLAQVWLDALNPGGRLLFPLQPSGGFGGMLLVTRPLDGGVVWPARFVSRAGFIACEGMALDDEVTERLTKAFAGGDWARVRGLHLDNAPDDTCWTHGTDWWLSTAPP